MTRSISFTVAGDPRSQGSKTIGFTKDGRAFMREANDKFLRPWRGAIRNATRAFSPTWGPSTPLEIRLSFVKRSADRIAWAPVVPDIDKLTRAVLDGVGQGGGYHDDQQIVRLVASKRLGPNPGVGITIRDAGPLLVAADMPTVRSVLEALADGAIDVDEAEALITGL